MFKLLLIWRYFLHKRVALLAVLAVTLVVLLVLVVLSVMSGLLEDVRQRNHGWVGDVVIAHNSLVGFGYYDEFLEVLAQKRQIAAATAVISTYGLVDRVGLAVQVFGVRLDEWCVVTDFAGTLHYQRAGQKPSFSVPSNEFLERMGRGLTAEQSRRGCISGLYLTSQLFTGALSKAELERVRQLGLDPIYHIDLGITVLGLSRQGTLTGSGIGEHQVFWYVDDSESRLVDVDMSALYVDFGELQKLCYLDGSDGGPKRAHEIRIKLKEGVGLERGRALIRGWWGEFVQRKEGAAADELLTEAKVQTWKEYRRGSIAPMEREKSLMVMVFLMIAAVAVFIVLAIFYMIVAEKIKDLGIIKSVGGSSWSVSQVFLGYGLLVGLLGAGLGLLGGSLIVTHSNEIEALINDILVGCNNLMSGWDWHYQFGSFHLWDPEVYAIERIPDVVNYPEAGLIALAAVAASVLGAALPALRAGRFQVVEALRVE